MFDDLRNIVLINAYWFSLPLIGYGLLRLIARARRLPDGASQLLSSVLRQHPFFSFFLSVATAVFIFGAISIPLYLVHAPAAVYTVLYCIISATVMGYLLFLIVRNIFSTRDISCGTLRGQTLLTKLLFVGLCLLLAVDFAFSLYVKSYALVSADTYVHLSRIVAILSQGFTAESGFFGDLPETGYHLNAIYALYVAPVQLFHLTPAEVWEYSFGFFRLLQWTAFFTLAWYICVVWLKNRSQALFASTLATVFIVLYFSANFFIAPYPNQIVIAWLVLLVIAMSSYARNIKAAGVAMLGTALLITVTHPLSGLMAALFVALVLAIRLIVERRAFFADVRPLWVYGITFILLMLGPVRTALFPSDANQELLRIAESPVVTIAGLAMKKPYDVLSGTALQSILFVVGTLGLLYLLYRLWKTKRQWAVACALVVFFPLVAYEPFGFSILHSVLPIWAIDRFVSMNVLTYLSIPLGIYAVLWLAHSIISKLNGVPGWLTGAYAGSVVSVALVGLLCLLFLAPSHRPLVQSRDGNEHYYNFMERTYTDFHNDLNQEKMVVANTGDSYFLAAILPVDVLAIEPGHTTPSADVGNRLRCQAQLLKFFEYDDLAAVRADYVVLAKYEKTFMAQKTLADTKPYLKRAGENQDFYVYKFSGKENAGKKIMPYPACWRYQQTEK